MVQALAQGKPVPSTARHRLPLSVRASNIETENILQVLDKITFRLDLQRK